MCRNKFTKYTVFNLNYLSDLLGTATTLRHDTFEQGNEGSIFLFIRLSLHWDMPTWACCCLGWSWKILCGCWRRREFWWLIPEKGSSSSGWWVSDLPYSPISYLREVKIARKRGRRECKEWARNRLIKYSQKLFWQAAINICGETKIFIRWCHSRWLELTDKD